MKKTIVISLSALILSSCGQGGNYQASTASATADVTTTLSFFGEENSSLAPVRLCDAVLTSFDGMESAFPDSTDDYFEETSPEAETFYYPAADIRNEPLVRTVQLRYNYVALFNRVIHSYEWFQRTSTTMDEDDDTATKKDTLEWIRAVRPRLSDSIINKALPNAKAQAHARSLMKAYDRFDGDDSDDSPFSQAVGRYTEGLSSFPVLVDTNNLVRFEEQFWDWYDKETVVPEIDSLIRMNFREYKGEKPTEEQLENMKHAIEAERDIDRRTILALEYAKFDHWNGAVLLGEILESRIYTKYLLEAWISWRANVQANHSPSSFGVIANNYYDHMRAICLDTMVRHCLESEDKNAEVLIENLIFCEIIHRMGSIYGNGSIAALANLMYGGEFVHPRLLDDNEDTLNE